MLRMLLVRPAPRRRPRSTFNLPLVALPPHSILSSRWGLRSLFWTDPNEKRRDVRDEWIFSVRFVGILSWSLRDLGCSFCLFLSSSDVSSSILDYLLCPSSASHSARYVRYADDVALRATKRPFIDCINCFTFLLLCKYLLLSSRCLSKTRN